MDRTLIKDLRRRLGLTQRQLADSLNVDQATVSRWERGVESPRPARRAKLQRLLMRDESRRATQRSLAFLRHDYLPSTLLDDQLRLVDISASGRRHFEQRGQDPDALLGMSLERYANRAGRPELYEQLIASGMIDGSALLFRFVQNVRGRGHATVYEPIFEDGILSGMLNYVTAYFDLGDSDSETLELIEVVQADDPMQAQILHRGPGAESALRHIRSA